MTVVAILLVDKAGHRTLLLDGLAGMALMLGVLTVAAFVFSYRLIPETKGRSLEAVQVDLRERSLTRTAEELDGESEYAD